MTFRASEIKTRAKKASLLLLSTLNNILSSTNRGDSIRMKKEKSYLP